jgi:hypothetical protein
MPSSQLVDVEKIVSDYLRTHPQIIALNSRTVSKTPDNTETAWTQITQHDARNARGSIPEYFLNHLLQLDCYAGEDGGKSEAKDLRTTVRELLYGLPEVGGLGATVTCVEFVGDAHDPDPDLRDEDGNARERYVLMAEVYAHA